MQFCNIPHYKTAFLHFTHWVRKIIFIYSKKNAGKQLHNIKSSFIILLSRQKKGTSYMLNVNDVFGKMNFNGGNLSSDGGAILTLQFLMNTGVEKDIEGMRFDDARRNPEYKNSDIVMQLTAKRLLGYFGQADQEVIGADPLLSKIMGPCCSQPTLSRFYRRACQNGNNTLKEAVTKMACGYVARSIDSPIIDADSTKLETFGMQEGSAWIPHYACEGMHPLMINEFKSRLLLSASLRTGSAYSSNGIIGELQTVMAYLGDKPGTRFRGDSAFYNKDLMEWLEGRLIQYYIRAKITGRLRNAIMGDILDKGVNYLSHDYRDPYYGEIQYAVSGSSKPRRVCYKLYCIHEDGRMSMLPEVYPVMTSCMGKSTKEVLDFYEERGSSENFTKELKNDFCARRVSHRRFEENELDFLVSSLAYNVFHLFQLTVLKGEDKSITMCTFRQKYQKVAVKVVSHARGYTLSYSSAYRHKALFTEYCQAVLRC